MPPSPWIISMNDARGAVAERRFERGEIVGGHEPHAGHQRFEILAVLGLAGDRERADRAAVERVLERDDLVLFRMDGAAVGMHHLDRAFDGFGAGVGRRSVRARPLISARRLASGPWYW